MTKPGRWPSGRIASRANWGRRSAIVVKHGRHTDALRIPHQTDRARRIGRVLRQIRDGVPLDELTHPYA